jgi:hypothetical protein
MRTHQIAALILAATLSTAAHAETWTTGDLDTHMAPGDESVFEADLPGATDAVLTIKYGLWDSPDMLLTVTINGVFAFDVLADAGYLSPGPTFDESDVTALLHAGSNEIRVTATDGGVAVLGSLTLDYTPAEGLWLSASGACPGPAELNVSGATPSGPWALISSAGPGSVTVPGGPCTGTDLGVSPAGLRLRRISSADAAGAGSLPVSLPDVACGAYVQALDLSSCEASNVVSLGL